MNDDLIKRSDAIKALNREKSDWNYDYNVPIDNCIKRLNRVKSADRPQGHWTKTDVRCTADEPLTETEIARAIVHKMIDDAVIAEDAYPDLRQKMHDAVDEYVPQTEREGE